MAIFLEDWGWKVPSKCWSCVCRFVVNEMIQSEKDYVKDLGVIVEVSLRVWLTNPFYLKTKWIKFGLFVFLRASCPGWKSEGFRRTWEAKTRSSLATSSRSMTGTASPSCTHKSIRNRFPHVVSNSLCVFSFSFFLVELERCVHNHDLLADLFIRHVSWLFSLKSSQNSLTHRHPMDGS